MVRVGYTKLQQFPGLIDANKLITQLNFTIDSLNNDLKKTTNKINALILKETGLWDKPQTNIKHAFLGSLVVYSLDPAITPQVL